MEFDKKFDYVIVGGGSAGCVLASRLTENSDISVCLLEYGGEGKDLAVRVPAGLILMVLGIIGEYLGKMILILNRTPQYIVRETINVSDEEEKK